MVSLNKRESMILDKQFGYITWSAEIVLVAVEDTLFAKTGEQLLEVSSQRVRLELHIRKESRIVG